MKALKDIKHRKSDLGTILSQATAEKNAFAECGKHKDAAESQAIIDHLTVRINVLKMRGRMLIGKEAKALHGSPDFENMSIADRGVIFEVMAWGLGKKTTHDIENFWKYEGGLNSVDQRVRELYNQIANL